MLSLIFSTLCYHSFYITGDEGVAMFRGGHMEYRASALSSSHIT